ncbi:GMC family oxidoreductase [Aquamicrobium segne]|uniref:GMC family oxidoreductase n=1 Tax=Aquamicrobium segne TaxID=469547 RepID=A0ABW0GXH7_9HYPH
MNEKAEAVEKEADVVIVGAGPSGAVAAKRLAEAGFSVICLEQGDYPDYTLARYNGLEFELMKDRYFDSNPNNRGGAGDYPIDLSQSEMAPQMWNGVGGSSVLFAGCWHRFRPSDFRVRTLDGVADDWPISYNDLAPFYDRVSADFSVSGIEGDPAYPHYEVPLPPFDLTAMEWKMIEAHDRLGWHWWPGSNAIATVKHNNLVPCVRRGRCLWSCFDGAKATPDRTHWPVARQLGVKLVTGARVLRIETGESGLATGVVYADRSNGTQHFVRGGVVIVSANSLGTTRLLLNSANNSHRDGLANSSGLVGKRLMMHPYSVVTGLFEDFFETWQGPFGQRLYSLEFAETRPETGFVRGAKWQMMGTGGPHNAFSPFPWADDVHWGKDFHKTLKSRFGRSISWGIMAEDLPEERNMVVLDPDLKDADGMPCPKVIYSYSDNTRKLVDFNIKMASQGLREAGAYEVIEAPLMRESGWHMLGACVMGNDASKSVVNAYGQTHDVPNLYIMDGSVMPTSSCVNPTGTVAALALRNTEAIINNAREQKTA